MTHVFGHRGSHGPVGMKIPSDTKKYGQPGYTGSIGREIDSLLNKTTSTKKKQTDTRPKSMPSFLSYKEPKSKPFSEMTDKEKIERFNKNQDKYKEQFEKKEGTIQDKVETNRYYAEKYGYEIPDDSEPKTKEQQIGDDRKLYRWYQDPEVIKATEKAKIESGGFIQDVADIPTNMYENYINRVTNVNKYFSNLLDNAKKEYISPEEPYWQRVLKERALTEWYGTGQLLAGTVEGALGLTLDTAAGYTASTIANFNDIYRALQGLPLNAEIHNDMTESLQEETVNAVMAYWESTAFGGMRTVTGKIPSMKATTNFIKAKVPFEFKNSVKVFKEMRQKKAKSIDPFNAKKSIIEADFKMVSEAAIKNAEVKKEIKQLAIQSWEQKAGANKYGPIVSNNVANHLRQKNKIMPVQALSVGAAVTPKSSLTLKEPFKNTIKEAVNSLPINEFNQIQVKDLTSVMSTKKYQRPMILTKFNDFVANLKENNIQNVDKKTIDTYINNNPLEFTINVAQRDAPLHLLEREKDVANEFIGAVGDLKAISTELANEVRYPTTPIIEGVGVDTMIAKSLPYVDAVKKSNIDYNLNLEYANTKPPFGKDRGRLDNQALLTNENLFKNITENYITFVTEYKSYASTEAELFNEFYSGKIPFKNYISKTGQVSHPGVHLGHSIKYRRDDVLDAYKDKIMYNIGFVDKVSKNFAPLMALREYKSGSSNIIPIKNSPVEGKIWTEKLLNSFNNRKHYDKDDSRAYDISFARESDTYLGYTADAPKFKTLFSLEEFIGNGVSTPSPQMLQYLSKNQTPLSITQLDGQPFSVNGLIELAKASKINTIQNPSPTEYVPTVPEQVYSTILKYNLNQIIDKMDLRDIPEWGLYISELRNDKWNSDLQYLSSLETSKAAVGKEIQKAKLQNKNDKIIKPFYKYEELKTSGSSDIKDVSYENRGGLTYTKHPYDKYMEIKLTSNNLSGYPEFGDTHFPETKNLVGWTINTVMRIDRTPINPNGNSLLVVHEMQSTDPMTEMGSLDNKPVLGTAWYGELTQRSPQKFFDLSTVIKPTDFNTVPLSSIDRQLLNEWKMINPKAIYKFIWQNFIKVPNVWQGKRSFELGYSIIPSNHIMDINEPLYIVADKEGNLMGHYQNINLTGKNEIITNVENATETIPPHKIIYDSYPSINKYLDEEFETYLKKEFKFDKQKEMGYGADWYKKVLWGQLRYAYDNGFNFMAFPTTNTINNKWGDRSGGNYDNMMNVVNKWGFKVLSEKDASGRYIGTDMKDWGFHAPEYPPHLEAETEALPFGQLEREYLNEYYGDDKIHIIDLRDRDKMWEILNKQEPTASLDKDVYQQTSELLSTFA